MHSHSSIYHKIRRDVQLLLMNFLSLQCHRLLVRVLVIGKQNHNIACSGQSVFELAICGYSTDFLFDYNSALSSIYGIKSPSLGWMFMCKPAQGDHGTNSHLKIKRRERKNPNKSKNPVDKTHNKCKHSKSIYKSV